MSDGRIGDLPLITGGTTDALAAATFLARDGVAPVVVEPDGGLTRELGTEQFLTPFRFDLGPAFFMNADAGWLARLAVDLEVALIRPDVPLAVQLADGGSFRLHREWHATAEQVGAADAERLGRLVAEGEELLASIADPDPDPGGAGRTEMTVRERLDAAGVEHPGLRTALTYLPLAFGLAVDRPGSAATVPLLLAGLQGFAAVSGGTGVLTAALADAVIAGGGSIVHGEHGLAGAAASGDGRPPASATGDGIGRVYLGVRGEIECVDGAHVTVHGIDGEDAVYEHLRVIRAGDWSRLAGHVTVRQGVDPTGGEAPLGSVVFQLLLPASPPGPGEREIRKALAGACADAIGDPDVVFDLTWLPRDTGWRLAELDWDMVAGDRALSGSAARSLRAAGELPDVLGAATGLATGRRLYEELVALRRAGGIEEV